MGAHASAPLLEGLRVLDLSSGPAGGLATMMLADFGADVLKIEPPGGDRFRSLAAAPVWLRGKRSLALDLRSEGGRSRLHELAAEADVAVASFRPGSAERLAADPATLRALNDGLIYCWVTGFGPEGPYARYPGYEQVVAAKSGRMLIFEGSVPRDGPVYAAVQLGTHVASQSAVQGVLAALLARERTGSGQLVETSLLRGYIPFDIAGLTIQQLRGRHPERFPPPPPQLFGRLPVVGYNPVPTADREWIQLASIVEHLFHAFIAAVDLGEIYADPRFEGAPYLIDDEAKEALRQIVYARTLSKSTQEWMRAFVENGNVAAEPWRSTQRALDHPQIVHTGDVITLDSPAHGVMRQLGPVAKLPATPASPAATRPAVGEHAGEGWRPRAEAPLAPGAAGRGAASGRQAQGPLHGVTVLEFASVVAVPYACTLLADLGARVIKLETLAGDSFRLMGNPGVGDVRGLGAIKMTASKESVALDLKAEAGRRIAEQLIERADVLIHNFRPGAPERLGIGYEQASALNPRLVYVSATGYGIDGPYAHRPTAHPAPGAALGGAYLQAGGVDHAVAGDDFAAMSEEARRMQQANEISPDPNASAVVATAALLGLMAQRRRGVGQHVQCNMMGANAYANHDDFVDYAGRPERPHADPDLLGLSALYRLYRAAPGAGDGERSSWLFLAVTTEREWEALAGAPGLESLAGDPRFGTPGARLAHDAELAAALSELLARRTADEWEQLLTSRDVAGVRADAREPGLFWDDDPHVEAAGLTHETDHPIWGPYRRHAPLLDFDGTPATPGPGMLGGQHARTILSELGYDEEAVDGLYERGVVVTLDY
ncbi:MAG: CoA transferase [Chloroflexi bacterium]|nr:CoA transferase [Chloroflexota bacterium]